MDDGSFYASGGQMYNRERRQKQGPKPIEIGTKRRGNIKKISDILVDIFGNVRIIAFVWIRQKIVEYRSAAYLPTCQK